MMATSSISAFRFLDLCSMLYDEEQKVRRTRALWLAFLFDTKIIARGGVGRIAWYFLHPPKQTPMKQLVRSRSMGELDSDRKRRRLFIKSNGPAFTNITNLQI